MGNNQSNNQSENNCNKQDLITTKMSKKEYLEYQNYIKNKKYY